MHIWDKDGSALLKPSRVKLHIYTAESPGRSTSTTTPNLHQDVTRLYISFGIDVSPATPRRPHRMSSSPTTIYINKFHRVTTITDRGHRQRQQNLLILQLATPRNSKQKIRV
jgi:hypothetical protein